jgi:predicted transposase YbfD/YdcC
VILDRGADWLFALKANRPAMLREVEAFFADPPVPLDAVETTDADHGRIETRRHRVTRSVDWLFSDRRYPDEPRTPGLATLACVEATRTEAGKTTRSIRFYLSSARLSPEAFARAVRGHWAIENSLHWVLDVTFDEDRARNRRDNGPETSRSCDASHSTCSTRRGRRCPSPESASAPDGPTPSQGPSSAKCDSLGHGLRRAGQAAGALLAF